MAHGICGPSRVLCIDRRCTYPLMGRSRSDTMLGSKHGVVGSVATAQVAMRDVIGTTTVDAITHPTRVSTSTNAKSAGDGSRVPGECLVVLQPSVRQGPV